MVRLRLLGVPLNLHFSHLLISTFIATSFLGWKTMPAGWPREALLNVDHPQHLPTVVLVTMMWAALVSFSVVVHEMGHALTLRAFGGQPQIHLIGLGGRTLVATEGPPLEWWQEALITLAGPAAGLAFGVLCGLLALLGGWVLPDAVRTFGTGMLYANLSWTVLNLLPITGLDGGVLTTIVLTRFFGRIGYLLAQVLALGLAALVLLWALASSQPLLAVLVAFMVMRTFTNINAWRAGADVTGKAPHPMTAIIERAEALYRERKLHEAQLVAQSLADDAATPPLVRSRAHVLLGWVALKEGAGRRALDHFAQVQGLEVPPQALAAAFSLIGDDARAVPLWERAAQLAPHDEVIRHEWAGALIRAGAEATARALPGVDLVRAFLAAERVHYVRKNFEAAALAAEAAFRERPHPLHAYTAACAWAQAGRADDAMRLLTLAAQNGYRDAAEAEVDADLRPLRQRADFVAWLTGLRESKPS